MTSRILLLLQKLWREGSVPWEERDKNNTLAEGKWITLWDEAALELIHAHKHIVYMLTIQWEVHLSFLTLCDEKTAISSCSVGILQGDSPVHTQGLDIKTRSQV